MHIVAYTHFFNRHYCDKTNVKGEGKVVGDCIGEEMIICIFY